MFLLKLCDDDYLFNPIYQLIFCTSQILEYLKSEETIELYLFKINT